MNSNDFDNNIKIYDTKNNSLLLVWARTNARTCTEVHCFMEEVFA